MLRVLLLLAVVFAFSSAACASAQGTFVRSPRHEDPSPSRGGVAHSTLGAAIEVSEPLPLAALTPLSQAIALYGDGEPPTSSPAMTALYHQVCADPERTRERRSGSDRGDEIARRQDCYCADDMPCSANPDCADLIVCHPQLAMKHPLPELKS